ncbi:MAG: GrpB family protein [Acidimicrobiales bacterium]
MEIFRFDQVVAIPIDEFGSRFRIGPLTAEDSRIRVQIIYVPAEGLIGRHPTTVRQMFCVVSGSGQVSGQDGQMRPIGSGYAALWEPGEDHDASSDGGLTAVCIEGEFHVAAFKVSGEIDVVDYDPQWPSKFEDISAFVWPAIENVALRIDHVGSTSVPGLAAKPIIDMDIVVESSDQVLDVMSLLGTIGYRWRGDYGVTGRESFAPPDDVDLPRHHLYLVVENNKAHMDHWLLRDLLREDPVVREEYANLKRRNAELAKNDLDAYAAAKARFVAGLLARTRQQRGLPVETYWDPESPFA